MALAVCSSHPVHCGCLQWLSSSHFVWCLRGGFLQHNASRFLSQTRAGQDRRGWIYTPWALGGLQSDRRQTVEKSALDPWFSDEIFKIEDFEGNIYYEQNRILWVMAKNLLFDMTVSLTWVWVDVCAKPEDIPSRCSRDMGGTDRRTDRWTEEELNTWWAEQDEFIALEVFLPKGGCEAAESRESEDATCYSCSLTDTHPEACRFFGQIVKLPHATFTER